MLGPNNDRWDCGGQCINGGLVGPGRDCDTCWSGTVIAQAIEARSAETERLGRNDESAVRQDAPVTSPERQSHD
jgi:hypothetical protein